jgi:hypothetical protein
LRLWLRSCLGDLAGSAEPPPEPRLPELLRRRGRVRRWQGRRLDCCCLGQAEGNIDSLWVLLPTLQVLVLNGSSTNTCTCLCCCHSIPRLAMLAKAPTTNQCCLPLAFSCSAPTMAPSVLASLLSASPPLAEAIAGSKRVSGWLARCLSKKTQYVCN